MVTPSGTLGLITTAPKLGERIQFACVVEGLHGPKREHARLQIMAYQDGKVVYGEAFPAFKKDDPYVGTAGEHNGESGIVLGGGSSDWKNETPTQPAECVVVLYYWNYQGGQKFVPLTTPITFEALGL